MTFGIRAKLLIFTILIILLIAGTLLPIFYFHERQQILQSYKRESVSIAMTMSSASFNDLYFLNVKGLRVLLETFRASPRIQSVYVVDLQGMVLADGTNENVLRNTYLPRKIAFMERVLSSKIWIAEINGDFLNIGGPVNLEGLAPIGYVYAGVSLEELRSIFSNLTRTYFFVFSGVLVISVVIVNVFSSLFTRRILDLTAAADRISSGSADTSVPISGKDEIARLGNAFKRMLDKLQALYKQERRRSQELSIEVASRRATEERLKDSESRYRAVVEDQTELICRFTPQRAVSFVNEAYARFFKLDSMDALGAPVFGNISDDDQARVDRVIAGLSCHAPVDAVDLNMIGEGSESRVINWTIRLICDEQEVPMEYQAVGRDVDELRQAQHQVLQAQKLDSLGQFAAGISHNLKNMLQPILALSQMTYQNLPKGSEAQGNLRLVIDATENAKSLVEKITAFGRHGEKQDKIIDINEAIAKTLEFARSTIPSNIIVDQELSLNSGMVRAEVYEIENVLLNVISNAAEAFEGASGRIEVALNKIDPSMDGKDESNNHGSFARIVVSDNGPGMDKATAEKIFDPFFTTKAVGKGMGMGLASAYGTVKKLEGAIDVDSHQGKGTKILIDLPLVGP